MSDRKESGNIVIVLRCPFCDSREIRQGYHNATFSFYVKCLDCLAIGPKKNTQQEALGAWNKRRATTGSTMYGDTIRL